MKKVLLATLLLLCMTTKVYSLEPVRTRPLSKTEEAFQKIHYGWINLWLSILNKKGAC